MRSMSVNSVPLVREKFSRPLTISEARKVCCVIFSSTGARRASSAHMLGQHLRVAGDDGQRRVDLVRDAGGEQADGGELLGLRELRLELHAVRDVVDQDDAADGDEVAREQRSDGDVGGAQLAGRQCEAELVERMRALLVAHAVESCDEVRREDGGELLAERVDARLGVHRPPSARSSFRCGRRDRRRRCRR